MADLVFYRGLYSGQQIDSAVARALSGGALDQEIAALRSAVGSPLVATTAAQMTNTNKIYVYTGSEPGYVAGNWYYFNGSSWTSGGVYNAVAVDTEMSSVSDNPVANRVVTAALADALAEAKAAAYDAYPTESASGAIASTAVGADGIPVKSLVAQIVPVQAAGTPSPENPLPISGWTAANIVVSPTQDAQDGTTYAISFPSEAGTVYGGTLTDNGDGTWTLTVTWYSIPGSRLGDTWILYAAPSTFRTGFSAATIGTGLQKKTGSLNIMCDRYKTEVGNENGTIHGDSGNTRVYITDSNYTTTEDFIAAIADAQFVYELIIPKTYTITAESVKSLLGDCNVWADTGDVSAVFRADPTLYIDSKIAALTALMSEI